MSKKHFVVQGAACQCKCSVDPQKDKLKVQTQSRHFANDKDRTRKLIATDKEIGQALEKNTFGKCKLQPDGKGDFVPCKAVILKWSNFYEKTTLSNQGKVLLEDSKGTCPVGGADCIFITDHGQTSEVTQKNIEKSKPEVVNEIFPGISFEGLDKAVLMIENEY